MLGFRTWCSPTTSRVMRGLLLLGLLVLSACSGRRNERATPATDTRAGVVAKSHAKPQLAHRAEPKAPLEQFVQQHVEEADASGKRVLVYVGATWCEPCQRFHKALESGQLDEALAGTEFVEFDSDRDASELRAAGYGSRFIPLFSVPDHSGHASGRAIEGSIKGTDAVRESLVPRLLALLDGKAVE
jgi:thiol-disulfide isomerase/thioredoxin